MITKYKAWRKLMKKTHPDLSKLKDKWPSPYVSRDKVGEFSGGILHPRSLANRDALGEGPRGRIRVNGKKIAYPVDALIEWLEAKSEMVGNKGEQS
jgi:hypothetical protein